MTIFPEFSASEIRQVLQGLFPHRRLVLSQFTFFNNIGVSLPTGETFRRGRRCYRLEDILSIATVLALKEEGIPLVILAGKEYGSGSSRDWAAKGPYLQGVKVVIAQSYERIHRSNLIGMGILPLQFKEGESAESLGLSGSEEFSVQIDDTLTAGQDVTVIAGDKSFTTLCRIDTPVEIDYYRDGGILCTVLKKLAKA